MGICRNIQNCISYLLWWTLFIVVGPLIFALLGLLFVWKFIIIVPLVKLSISKMIQGLNAFDGILATDSFWKNPLATIGLLLIVDGKIDISELRLHFAKTVLEAKTSDGRCIYNKLFTIPKEFAGYYFWESCPNFKLEDHVREVDCSSEESYRKTIFDDDDDDMILQKLCSNQTKTPFEYGKPLWDITLFSNYSIKSTNSSALFLRFHHSSADGYTVIKLVDRLTGLGKSKRDNTPEKMKKAKDGRKFSSWTEKIKFIFKMPSIIGHFYIDNIFYSNVFTSRKTTKDFLLSWTSISLDQLRSIRQKTSTHFTPLTISLLCGSLRKHLEDGQIKPSILSDSSYLRVVLPLPWPNHPSHKMTNHWTMGIVESSFHPHPSTRLKITQEKFQAMLNSGTPLCSRIIGPKLLTLFPSFILKYILNSNHIGNGIIFTSVPGSSEKSSTQILGKYKIKNMIPIIGPQYSQTGIVCVIFTYNGKANCTIVGNVDIVQNQVNMNKICHQYLHEEIATLLSPGTGNEEELSEETILLHEIV